MTDTQFTRDDIVRAIAYTNILHLTPSDPVAYAVENPEDWNRQITYAHQIIRELQRVRWVTNEVTV